MLDGQAAFDGGSHFSIGCGWEAQELHLGKWIASVAGYDVAAAVHVLSLLLYLYSVYGRVRYCRVFFHNRGMVAKIMTNFKLSNLINVNPFVLHDSIRIFAFQC